MSYVNDPQLLRRRGTGSRGGDPMTCPHCGRDRFFGPGLIVDSRGKEHAYYSCACCHTLSLMVDGVLVAKCGAW